MRDAKNRPRIMHRDKKNAELGFRMSANKKDAFEKAVNTYAEFLLEKGIDDLNQSKIFRNWTDEFVKAVNAGTLPVWPPKFYCEPALKPARKPRRKSKRAP